MQLTREAVAEWSLYGRDVVVDDLRSNPARRNTVVIFTTYVLS